MSPARPSKRRARSISTGRRVDACGAGSVRCVQPEVIHRNRAYATHTQANREVRRPRRHRGRREARLGPTGRDRDLGRLGPVDPTAGTVAVVEDDEDVWLGIRLVPGSHSVGVAWRDRRSAGAAVLRVDELAVAARPGADREVLGVAARMGVGRVRPAVRVRAVAAEQPAGRSATRGLLKRGVLEQVVRLVVDVGSHAGRRGHVAGGIHGPSRKRVVAIGDHPGVPAVRDRGVHHRPNSRPIDQEIDVVEGDVVRGVGRELDLAGQGGSARGGGERDRRRRRVSGRAGTIGDREIIDGQRTVAANGEAETECGDVAGNGRGEPTGLRPAA